MESMFEKSTMMVLPVGLWERDSFGRSDTDEAPCRFLDVDRTGVTLPPIKVLAGDELVEKRIMHQNA